MHGKVFYDIHCHVMNLSHPNYLAFLRRFEPILKENKLKIFFGANTVMIIYLLFNSLSPRTFTWLLNKVGVTGMINRVKNLLAVMEHDAATVLYLLDKEMEENLLQKNQLSIGNFHYHKIVLTPLMMDFGYKNMTNSNLYYNSIPIQKPIVEQVVDIFNGIRSYCSTNQGKRKFFEVYPFLGINTANYTLEKIEKMLDKYFSQYRGKPLDLAANMGKFSGDIESMGSNFFSGIKVYPPLGFDPWPEEKEERKKVELIYEFSMKKRIPITTHCSNGGYRIIDTREAELYTSPARWEMVLKRYPQLKLNFGHMGNQETKRENRWGKEIISLMTKYENVYGDFSCRGFNNEYYGSLKMMIDEVDSENRERVKRHILFGSDFTINLLWMNSYSNYLKIYRDTPCFSDEEKDVFASVNPEHFLFG